MRSLTPQKSKFDKKNQFQPVPKNMTVLDVIIIYWYQTNVNYFSSLSAASGARYLIASLGRDLALAPDTAIHLNPSYIIILCKCCL